MSLFRNILTLGGLFGRRSFVGKETPSTIAPKKSAAPQKKTPTLRKRGAYYFRSGKLYRKFTRVELFGKRKGERARGNRKPMPSL